MESPFAVGSLVTWADNAPKIGRFISTPGPMTVISALYDDGSQSEYAKRFGGIPRQPGWIITVEYNADATDYYDPPLSYYFHKQRIQSQIHEMWLVPVDSKVQL